jgi:hypothetical protein
VLRQLQLKVVAKPAAKDALLSALQAEEGAVFPATVATVHVYADQPLQAFLLQQMLRSLGYLPKLHDLQQSDFSATALCLYPSGADVSIAAPVLFYSQHPGQQPGPANLWLFSDGPAALSEHLFNLRHKKSVE